MLPSGEVKAESAAHREAGPSDLLVCAGGLSAAPSLVPENHLLGLSALVML